MTDTITRCPKCLTSFRINDEHINTARGAVRCGSCLTVFNAKENTIEHSQEETVIKQTRNEPEEHVTNTKPNTSSDTADEDDNILISDDMSDDGDINTFDENVFISHGNVKSDLNLFERNLKSIDDELNINDQDESWALNLLDDENAQDLPPGAKTVRIDASSKHSPFLSGSTLVDKNKIDKPLDSMFAQRQSSKYDADDDDAYLPDNLEDDRHNDTLFDDDISDNSGTYTTDYDSFDSQHNEAPDINADERMHPDTDIDDAYDQAVEHNIEHSETPIKAEKRFDFLEDFEPDPVEILVENQQPFWQSTPFWSLLSVIAALLIIAQLAYFQFDTLARKAPYRAYYAAVCDKLDCTLPVLQDLKKIRIDTITVINHPDKPNALLVDAVISNQANYEQSFPTLQLHFTDLQGRSISQHRFQPKDYVGGELAGSTLMPQRNPIHIQIAIEDPGKNAVNYRLEIVKP